MLLMNISGLDASTSVINERVQIELENMLDEYEEKKIQHERARRDELKKLEQIAAAEKKKLQDDAKKEVDLTKSQMERTQQKDRDSRITQRRAQLQNEKDQRIREAKDVERSRKQTEEKDLV